MTLDIINRIADHEPQPFIAPIPTRNTDVFTIQDGIPYLFKGNHRITPGWYKLHPKKDSEINIIDYGESIFLPSYTKIFDGTPVFYVIALFPIADKDWLVMPYNISDANQRGWKNGIPKTIYLVEENIKPMDILFAYQINNWLIFRSVAYLTATNYKEMAIAKGILSDRLKAMQKADEKHIEELKIQTNENRIKDSLNSMGASLNQWTREIDGYSVTWSHEEREHTMKIDTNLRVRSAGVCLGNTDNMHSLSSVVAVMQHRQREIDSGRHGDW